MNIVVKETKPQQANGYTNNKEKMKERIGVNRQTEREGQIECKVIS